jgi:hypothetical protein
MTHIVTNFELSKQLAEKGVEIPSDFKWILFKDTLDSEQLFFINSSTAGQFLSRGAAVVYVATNFTDFRLGAVYNAYGVEDIKQMLPISLHHHTYFFALKSYTVPMADRFKDCFSVGYYKIESSQTTYNFTKETLFEVNNEREIKFVADAMGELLLWCIQERHVTMDTITI